MIPAVMGPLHLTAGVPAAGRALCAAAEPDPAGQRGRGRGGAGARVLEAAAGGVCAAL